MLIVEITLAMNSPSRYNAQNRHNTFHAHNLPLELLRLIFEQLLLDRRLSVFDQLRYRDNGQSPLLRCSMVCYHWREVAWPLVWRRLVISPERAGQLVAAWKQGL